MSCPTGTYSGGTVPGQTGCTSANKCGLFWQHNTSYTHIFDKCYDNKTGAFVNDYYLETSFGACC